MRQYKFYQGLNFQAVSTTGKLTKTVLRTHIYLISHGARTQHHTQKEFSVEMFIFFRRSIYLPRHELKPQTLDTPYEYLHTHTSLEELHTERSEGTTAFNPLCAAISPKCDSSPLFLFIFNFFLQPPSFSL